MKYMILIHSNPTLWESLPKEEADRVLGNHYKIIEEMKTVRASWSASRASAGTRRSSSSRTASRP